MDYYERAMDDAALVRAACEGDKNAFAGIYDRYSDRLYSFLCTVVRNRDEAADLLQDTFLTAGARLHQLRDPDKLRPWLYAIARHLAMKSLSRSGRQDPLDDLEVTDTAPGPSEVAAQSELATLINDAAEGLGAQDRVVLDLHLRQGLEGQELGRALGVSAGHAYVMLSRMRDQVERSLGALLVARQGSGDCGKLRAILKPWDGRFTATWRKRVARHVDGCEVCGELRKRMLSPISMLGTIPMLPAPAHARAAVLEQVQLVGHAAGVSSLAAGRYAAERWPVRYEGFPPPIARRRRPVIALAAGLALLLMLLTGPTVALVGEPAPEAPEPPVYPLVFPTDAFQPPQPLPPQFQPVEVLEPDETASTPGRQAPPAPRPTPAGRRSPSAPTSGPPPAPGEDPSPPSEDPSPPGEDPSAGGEPGRDAEPADTRGPVLRLSISPRQIGASGRECSTGLPRASTVSVTASDPSGVGSVTLQYSGPPSGSQQMAGSGGSYSATIGPFTSQQVPPGSAVTLSVTVRATDGHGNPSSARGSLVVSCTSG